jgi:hypothetical protein
MSQEALKRTIIQLEESNELSDKYIKMLEEKIEYITNSTDKERIELISDQKTEIGMLKLKIEKGDIFGVKQRELEKEIRIYQDKQERIFQIARDNCGNQTGRIIGVILESHESYNKIPH